LWLQKGKVVVDGTKLSPHDHGACEMDSVSAVLRAGVQALPLCCVLLSQLRASLADAHILSLMNTRSHHTTANNEYSSHKRETKQRAHFEDIIRSNS